MTDSEIAALAKVVSEYFKMGKLTSLFICARDGEGSGRLFVGNKTELVGGLTIALHDILRGEE